MYSFDQISNEHIATVNPQLQMLVRRALRISSRRLDGGVGFKIPDFGGLRSNDDQALLIQAKKSTSEYSAHLTGHAIDVEPIMPKGTKKADEYTYYMIVATCMLQAASELSVRIGWGGNFQHKQDLKHYELK